MNQRPLAPQGPPAVFHGVGPGGTEGHPAEKCGGLPIRVSPQKHRKHTKRRRLARRWPGQFGASGSLQPPLQSACMSAGRRSTSSVRKDGLASRALVSAFESLSGSSRPTCHWGEGSDARPGPERRPEPSQQGAGTCAGPGVNLRLKLHVVLHLARFHASPHEKNGCAASPVPFAFITATHRSIC